MNYATNKNTVHANSLYLRRLYILLYSKKRSLAESSDWRSMAIVGSPSMSGSTNLSLLLFTFSDMQLNTEEVVNACCCITGRMEIPPICPKKPKIKGLVSTRLRLTQIYCTKVYGPLVPSSPKNAGWLRNPSGSMVYHGKHTMTLQAFKHPQSGETPLSHDL